MVADMAIISGQQIAIRDSEGWQQLPADWSDCLRRVLAARGIRSASDLRWSLHDLPRPDQLSGMATAVALLEQALDEQWHVMVVADFDSDGATSCALAVRGLRAFGLKQIDYIVPNRFKHGYGLTPALLEDIDAQHQPDCLLTVDNGIASLSGVAAAKARGMKVLITDHHLPGETLPEADAIINPNQQGEHFPGQSLAGVGVCFYLLLGLRQHLRQKNWFEKNAIAEPNMAEFLDLVAVGTVADLVPMDTLNRTLVSSGLDRLRQGRTIAGVRALMTVAGREQRELNTADIGFAIAPRLNAAGRMEDMRIGIELLLNDDMDSALQQARLLDEINQERKQVEQIMQADAMDMLMQMEQWLEDSEQPPGYCLYDPAWHQGVIGLLASRVKELKHRPVIVFADDDSGELKGSARSIPGIHIRDLLAHIDARNPGLIARFGGHAMAAGLSLPRENLPVFTEQMYLSLQQLADAAVYQQTLLSDGELPATEMDLQLARQLPVAAPWGQAFQAPQFHGVFEIISFNHVGQDQSHLKLLIALEDGRQITAMAFRQTAPDWLQDERRVLLVYRLDVNTFRQQSQLQLLVDHLLPAQEAAAIR
ncbi:ssDNA-specific exonuclease RecJ [Methylophaga lonarensis MPL]|uniref:Single-stranded-DNA-specific exonuclease RecJ n=2 Tax=Methylophaga lonarensis TaxID=999151 RepID=M7PG44_9GAMM|nr:ssDNA-specific exonuclease RecJ [Methylophaga lonarensis MPL]